MSKIQVHVAGVVMGKGGNCQVTVHAPTEEVLAAVGTVLAEVRELRGEVEALRPEGGGGSRLVRHRVNGWPLDGRP